MNLILILIKIRIFFFFFNSLNFPIIELAVTQGERQDTGIPIIDRNEGIVSITISKSHQNK